ncbi:MAG: hypothetical protein LBV07_05465, partial [Syntrophobacterales bacterium]|nr:hypothetical protein [Syntrophobacterales bacterium]
MKTETVQTILERMKSPLRFASQENFAHLTLLKDVEMLMTRLLSQLGHVLKEGGERREAGRLFQAWRNLFHGFDALSVAEKKERLRDALVLHDEMVSYLTSSGTENQRQQTQAISAKDHKAAEHHLKKLSLPVQYIKGVGPRFAALLNAKKLKTVGDLLYFLPYRYEDRRS